MCCPSCRWQVIGEAVLSLGPEECDRVSLAHWPVAHPLLAWRCGAYWQPVRRVRRPDSCGLQSGV